MLKPGCILIGFMMICAIMNAQNATCIYTPYNKVFTPPLTANPAGNTIGNSTFENNNLNSWSLLPNATRILIANGGHNSTYCAKLISKNTAGGDAYMNQTITNLIPGNSYDFSAWLKSNLPTNNNVLSAEINIRFNYPGGNYSIISKSCFPTTTWTKYTNSFTVPTTPNLQQCVVQIFIYRGQKDSVYVDDLELNVPASTFGFMNAATPVAPTGVFEENFLGSTGNTLSTNKWLVVKKAWGNNSSANNNGVVPENLELLCTGGIRFHGHGDLYTGPIMGVGNALGNGKIRVGSCIATKDYYASGRYEVVAKLTPGMVNAFWTFHYIEDAAYQSGGIKNSEIDWEFPSNNINGNKSVINDGLCNSWGGLCNGTGLSTAGISFSDLLNTSDASQAFHHYAIDWHTGGNGISPSISWYFDSVLVRQVTTPSYISFRASRFWLGVWYGNSNWITGGNTSIMQYVDKFMEVKSVKITPFYEANDIYENETDPVIGYAMPNYYPTFPCNSITLSGSRVKNNSESLNPIQTNKDISESVILYPNPAQHQIHIQLTSETNDVIKTIELHDALGRLLKRIQDENINYEISIDSDIQPGQYYIEGKTLNGSSFIKRLIIQ